jgi:hypothetical protein
VADTQLRQASDNPSHERKSSVGLGMSGLGGKAELVFGRLDFRF